MFLKFYANFEWYPIALALYAAVRQFSGRYQAGLFILLKPVFVVMAKWGGTVPSPPPPYFFGPNFFSPSIFFAQIFRVFADVLDAPKNALFL